MIRHFTLCIALCLAGSAALARAADWPQWRGPHRDGISPEKGLARQWPAEGPPQVWHATDLGDGYSTPSVVGDRLYVLGNQGMENEYVEARAVADGKKLWSTRLGNVGPNQGPQYPGSRSTPTVDGDVLYALGSDGDLVCVELASGKERWRKQLRGDFGGEPGQWAYSESPLVDGQRLIVTPGGGQATIVALDKTSGDVIWKAALPEADQASYSSAIVTEAAGQRQYVQFVQKALVGLQADSGKLLWRYDRTSQGSQANIPTPIAHNGYIYSSTGRIGGGLVHIKSADDALDAEQVYFGAKLPMSIGGSVLVDGYLYGTNGQGLMCVDFATGDLKWQNRAIGPGSICYADGLLVVHGEKGAVALVAAAADDYHELGQFTPQDGPDRGRSAAWAYPIIAGGKLYIRDLSSLWCYDVMAK